MAHKLRVGEWYTLYSFLMAHEYDIACDTNDFGKLKKLFKAVVGFEAERGR